jgi:hypothetical protein
MPYMERNRGVSDAGASSDLGDAARGPAEPADGLRASSAGAQMGSSLPLRESELFLPLLNDYVTPTQRSSPCKPARALAPRLPRSEEVWYAG